ncbi:MAG: peptidoglycan-binding protein [Clostridiales bacterium]|nr:peptidoglycan-binding protein [Clostridiales bacterium]
MSWGHDNIATIGTAALNSYAGTSFLSTLSYGTSHAEVSILKGNLRDYRILMENQDPGCFSGVPSLTGNTSQSFDNDTKLNLQKFQQLEGLSTDGIYGQASRNRMALAVGVSSKGYVRMNAYTTTYINYNDTSAGMSADSTYKLDHSWLTSSALTTIGQLASTFKVATNKRLEINDCCLIDGANTPEHSSHENGKDADIRNAGLTTTEQVAFLNACVANSGVNQVLYYSKLGIVSNKIIVDSNHTDHFHVDFV